MLLRDITEQNHIDLFQHFFNIKRSGSGSKIVDDKWMFSPEHPLGNEVTAVSTHCFSIPAWTPFTNSCTTAAIRNEVSFIRVAGVTNNYTTNSVALSIDNVIRWILVVLSHKPFI